MKLQHHWQLHVGHGELGPALPLQDVFNLGGSSLALNLLKYSLVSGRDLMTGGTILLLQIITKLDLCNINLHL